MRRFTIPRFHALVFLIAVLSLLALDLEKFADDPGVGWHLATGEWILQNHSIPRVDPFLHSAQPRAWISDQWLSDLILALLFNRGGFPLLYVILPALFFLAYFSLLAGSLRKSGSACVAATIAAVFAYKIAQVHLILRPVMFGIVCFLVLFARLLPLYRNTETLAPTELAGYGKKLLWQLPLLFLFWANLHPSFSLGLLLIVLLMLGFFLNIFFFSESGGAGKWRVRQRLCLNLFIVCALATMVNPYGYALHQSIFSLTTSKFFMTYHQEWNPPDLHSSEGQLFQLILAAAFLSFFVRIRQAVTLVDFLVLAFFVHTSLTAVRFLPFFGIVISPYVAQAFSIFAHSHAYPGQSVIEHAWKRIADRERMNYPATSFISLVLVFILIFTISTNHLPVYPGSYGPRASVYSYEALRSLQSSSPIILAAEPAYGGFITWQGGGRMRALIDDRNTLLGEDFYKEYTRHLAGGEGWREFFRQQGATHLMLSPRAPLAQEIERDKSLAAVYSDGLVTIFAL